MRTVRARRGISLIEASIAIIVIGVLAGIAIPRFFDSVERARAAHAFDYLSAMRSAQNRFRAREGTYTSDISRLDIQSRPPPQDEFSIGVPEAGDTGQLKNSWTITITRRGAGEAYGSYRIIFNDEGFDHLNSTIPQNVNPLP